MRVSQRRWFGCLSLLAVGAVGLSPASAGAVTLGSHHIDVAQRDFGSACPTELCTVVQTRLPGAQVRAPFSGEVRKWRVVGAGTDYQLVVMHKKPNGKFKNVGVSSVGSTTDLDEYEFSASLSIHKGDYVGLMGDAFQGISNTHARIASFVPAVQFPDARKPSSRNVDEFQFNAVVRH